MIVMNKILDEVKGATTIAIGGHIRPDGDCVGSCLALYLYLSKTLKKADIKVFLEKPRDIFNCISGINEIKDATKSRQKFDVFIALDCNEERLGDSVPIFRDALKKINIDHHISNTGCGDVNYIFPQASSTSELIFDLMDESYLDKEIAKAIYIGIIHDTGVFQYSNTSEKTLQIAAKLISFDFDFPKLIDETFYEKTYIQNQILGRALLESVLFMNKTCIVSAIDKKTMEFYNVVPADLDGIVNQLRYTKGVECAIFLYESDFQQYKVSMRSGGEIDVSKIAQYFGGGGHVRAAGCSMNGTVYDVINNLSLQIEKQMEMKNND